MLLHIGCLLDYRLTALTLQTPTSRSSQLIRVNLTALFLATGARYLLSTGPVSFGTVLTFEGAQSDADRGIFSFLN